MILTSFNHGWGVRPRGLTFFAMGGLPYESVTLPHDALISTPRNAEAVDGANTGFFPNVDLEHENHFDVAGDAAAILVRAMTADLGGSAVEIHVG